jgi:hypothetical protein
MTSATVEASADHGTVRIRLCGEIDLENVATVDEQMCAAVSGQPTGVSVDLTQPYLHGQCGNTVAFRSGLPFAEIEHCAEAYRAF